MIEHTTIKRRQTTDPCIHTFFSRGGFITIDDHISPAKEA